MTSINDIDQVAGLDEDALYLLAGRYVASRRMLASPPDEPTLSSFGKNRFSELLPEIQVRICGNVRLKSLVNDDSDERTLILAVLDILSSLATGGIPIIVVSALVIKIGMNRICPSP